MDDGELHGDPTADAEWHQQQNGDADCMPTSIAMALSRETGTWVDADDVTARADALGLLGDAGMTGADGATLAEAFGAECVSGTGDLDDVAGALDAGDAVVVGLDADDLYGTLDGDDGPLTAGHAVVVTGVDDAAGVVYLADPATPEDVYAVDLDRFEDAWSDAGDEMIVVGTAPDAGDDLLRWLVEIAERVAAGPFAAAAQIDRSTSA